VAAETPTEPDREALSARGLPRNVKVLSWVSFFQDAASELLYPVLPLFITGTLGAPPSVLGLIEGVAEGTASVGKAVSGWFADRWQRRPLIALGYGISSLAKPIIGLAGGWPLVLVSRFADRVGKGIRTSPRDALIAADTPPELRGRAFGFHRAADSAGAVVGPLLGLALYEALNHRLRPLFFFAVIPALLSVGLITLVRESPRPAPAPVALPGAPSAAGPLPGRYWRVVAFLGLFGLVNFSDAFIILRASDLGLGFASIILAYALYNALYAGLSYPAGVVSDRLPRHLVFAVGLGVFAVAYLGLGLARSSGWVWVLLPLYGAYTALTDGVGRAWVANLVPADRLGRGLGFYQAIIGATALIAGVWAGLAWSGDGRTPLIVSGAVAAALALVMVSAGRWLEGGGT
jgi:MFS family permease